MLATPKNRVCILSEFDTYAPSVEIQQNKTNDVRKWAKQKYYVMFFCLFLRICYVIAK